MRNLILAFVALMSFLPAQSIEIIRIPDGTEILSNWYMYSGEQYEFSLLDLPAECEIIYIEVRRGHCLGEPNFEVIHTPINFFNACGILYFFAPSMFDVSTDCMDHIDIIYTILCNGKETQVVRTHLLFS